MDNIAIYSIFLLLGAALGVAACYVWAVHRLSAMQAKVTIAESRAELISEHQELTVQIDPFVSLIKDSGWFNKTTTVETGYQYQLLVRGFPCFDPHRVVLETRKESDINEAGVERLKVHASELARLAVNSTPVGRAATLISIAVPKLMPKGAKGGI